MSSMPASRSSGKKAFFYDIGASVGYISIEMASVLKKGRVIAFEPQPALAENVVRSARLNGFDHLDVFQVMLGDKPGDSALYVGSHSIHASAMAREAGSQKLSCSMTDDQQGRVRDFVLPFGYRETTLQALAGRKGSAHNLVFLPSNPS